MFPHLLGDLPCGLKREMANSLSFSFLLSSTDSNIPPGTVLFTNGVPYTYQNGMAIFQSPEGSYPVPQPQVMGSILEKGDVVGGKLLEKIVFLLLSEGGGLVEKKKSCGCVYDPVIPF